MKKYSIFFISLCFFSFQVRAQASQIDSLSNGDINEIKYLSESFIEEFELLLNTVVDPELGEYKRNEISVNSYNPASGNQIFVDGDVIIEDDIDPNYFEYQQRSKDSPVKKYLNDLDLFYEKSVEPTIDFSEIETFSIGVKDYVYAVVYYKSFFRSQHRIIKRPYRQSERVATIKAERIGRRWKLSIVSIVFYNPDKHVNELNPDISQIPLELTAEFNSPAQTDSTIFLKWGGKSNNVFPLTYNLYEGGMLLASMKDSTYQVVDLKPETKYNFHLTVVEDSTGRISPSTKTFSISTKEAPKPIPVKSFAFKDVLPVYKKGFDYQLEWSNKLKESGARLEIRDKDGELQHVIEQSQLRNSTEWTPDDYKVGSGYQFVLRDPKNKEDITYSSSFKIVRKVPLFLKIAPVLVVGAVVGVIASGSGSSY
ncbi:hypothetical protein [Chondrinema litorale]|uniref:hypothetical protein n=1 Tax=Chondrinema litorale TaxID=2994555 RepID=UPI0025439D5E|nr:hypothetical protein [Chondrinema litorale]UZR95149.1 hypothetical protein OQ292_04875 [Chondrinema litorale]